MNKVQQWVVALERENEQPETYSRRGGRLGVDELNLAEFPIAAVSDRIAGGKKSFTCSDQVYDRNENKWLPRQLVVSGSDHYGLPTAKDDDILLACIQLSHADGFKDRSLRFSRYELLKLLKWSDNSRNYQRLAKGLRCWKGVSIYSERAFYDKANQSWVNRDFGIIDTLYVYQREHRQGHSPDKNCRLSWNDVFFRSFESGYLKTIDWDLYLSFESHVAKRLYRFLDKRFYHRNCIELGLHDLAFDKLRLSPNYDTAQIKRVLQRGIEELEYKWELRSMDRSLQFQKNIAGKWIARFERKRRRSVQDVTEHKDAPTNEQQKTAQSLLIEKGVKPSTAQQLASLADRQLIETMAELYDWYRDRGHRRDVGFLIYSIKNPNKIEFPSGFESRAQAAARKRAQKSRNRQQRDFQSRRNAEHAKKENARREDFRRFWEQLSEREQSRFDSEALDSAKPFVARRFKSAQIEQGNLFASYQLLVRLERFETMSDVDRARWLANSA